jgi:hypothetical protein
MKYVTKAALNFLAVLIVGECIVIAISDPRLAAGFVAQVVYSIGMWSGGTSPMEVHFVRRPPDLTIPPDMTGPPAKGGPSAAPVPSLLTGRNKGSSPTALPVALPRDRPTLSRPIKPLAVHGPCPRCVLVGLHRRPGAKGRTALGEFRRPSGAEQFALGTGHG